MRRAGGSARLRQLWWLTMAVLLVGLAGCGSDGGGTSDETSTGGGTSVTTGGSGGGTPPVTGSAPSGGGGESVLRRRDVRPADVADQNKFFSGGPPPTQCNFLTADELGDPTDPTVVVPGFEDPAAPNTGRIGIGEAAEVCFLNFTPNRPITLEIAHDGDGVEQEVCWQCPGQPAEGFFTSAPGDPVGSYDVTATQAVSGQPTKRATGQFTLGYQPEGNGLLVVAESPSRGFESVPRGTTVHVSLAGFGPGASVPLALYYTPTVVDEDYGSLTLDFVAVEDVTMDSHGQTLVEIETLEDDPRGCYVFDTSPPVPHNASVGELDLPVNGFCLS